MGALLFAILAALPTRQVDISKPMIRRTGNGKAQGDTLYWNEAGTRMNDKKTILLVEDEALVAMLEKKTLEQYGYAVVTADTGEKAIQTVAESRDIDLILMDINLGAGIEGTEAAQRILASHDLPLIFLSSHTEREVVEKTEGITSYGYVVKNSSITVIDASIKMAFKLFYAKKNEQEKEALLQENAEKYRLLHENAGMGIACYSPEGMVQSYNKLAAQHMNGEPEDFTGKSIRELFPAEAAAVYLDRIRHATLSATPLSYEDIVSLPSGEKCFLSIFTRICDPGGRILGIQIISQDISARRQDEDRLKKSIEQFETLTNLAPVGIYLTDPDGSCTYTNPAWQKMAGLSAAEALGQGWVRGLHPDDVEMVFSSWKRMVESRGQWGMEYRFRDRAGTVTDVYGLASAQQDDAGRIVRFVGVNIDITERKKAEQLSIQSKNEAENAGLYMQLLLSTIDDVIVSRDLDNRVAVFNKAFAEVTTRLFGQSAHIGMNTIESLPTEARQHWEGILEQVKTGQRHTEEYPFQLPDGQTAWYRTSHVPIIRLDQIVGTLELTQDITRYKRLEDSYRENETRYKMAQAVAHVGSWEYDIAQGSFWGSDEGKAIYGFDMDSDRFTAEEVLKCVVERDRVNQALIDLIGKNQPYDLEFEITPLHSIRRKTIHSIADLTRDDQGRPIRVIGTLLDITERKRVQIELLRSQELLRVAEEVGKIGAWEFDVETLEQHWTDETFRILEIDLDHGTPAVPEGLGFILPEYREKAERAMQQAIEFGEPYSQEWEVVTTKGKIKWVQAVGRACREQGRTVKLTGSFQDITERKLHEEKLRLLLAKEQLILKEVHHRIKNNMGTMKAILALQAGFMKDPAAISALEDAGGRIRSMELLYDKLYQSPNLGEHSTRSYLSSLADEILANFPANTIPGVEKQLDDFVLDAKTLQPLGIILNELLTNIMKYAFDDSTRDPKLCISLKKEAGQISLSVRDNGKGLPGTVDFDHPAGFGLTLVHVLATQLDGTVRIIRVQGTEILITFPVRV